MYKLLFYNSYGNAREIATFEDGMYYSVNIEIVKGLDKDDFDEDDFDF